MDSSIDIAGVCEHCEACAAGRCVSTDTVKAARAEAHDAQQALQALSDAAEALEFQASSRQSAHAAQVRVLERELLALDLAFSGLVAAEQESVAARDQLVGRAQRHISERNFLRRVAGQQQVRLVNGFGARSWGRGARGGQSDDSMFGFIAGELAEHAELPPLDSGDEALKEAEAAALLREHEVRALVDMFNGRHTDARAQEVLAWYNEKQASIAAAPLIEEAQRALAAECSGVEPITACAVVESAPAEPPTQRRPSPTRVVPPGQPKGRSIFDNPKYRAAAARAMTTNASYIGEKK